MRVTTGGAITSMSGKIGGKNASTHYRTTKTGKIVMCANGNPQKNPTEKQLAAQERVRWASMQYNVIMRDADLQKEWQQRYRQYCHLWRSSNEKVAHFDGEEVTKASQKVTKKAFRGYVLGELMEALKRRQTDGLGMRDVYEETHIVGADETAAKVGSGLLEVYATPQVVALMEHAACELIKTLSGSPKGERDERANEGIENIERRAGALEDGETTVGIENIERRAGALEDGETTVGTRMAIDHVKACRVGEEVTAKAELLMVVGRKYEFAIEVRNSKGELLAKAEHTRFKVNAERFMGKI